MIERERRQWKRAVETANEGIAILDADGRYVQMNDAYAEAFDEQVIPALEREGTWDGEAAAQRADGTVVDQQLSLSMLKDGGHVCVMEVLDVRDGG